MHLTQMWSSHIGLQGFHVALFFFCLFYFLCNTFGFELLLAVMAALNPSLPFSFGSTLTLAGPAALMKTFMLTRLKKIHAIKYLIHTVKYIHSREENKKFWLIL